jgi:putative transposase
LKDFLVTSDGEKVSIPQFARKSEKRRQLREFRGESTLSPDTRLNKALSHKKKGSRRRQKAVRRLSKHYQKVARQRRDFHFKTAKWLLDKYDVIAYEDLNIKGLAKTKMSKSILDAGWAEFIAIVAAKAENAGRLAIAVNPNGTTQRCSGCDKLVPKTLADRWHNCPHCLLELDRDINAAINIKKLALGHRVNKARGVRRNTGTMKREAVALPLVG